MKGEIWCLCTVTFGQNGPKLNSTKETKGRSSGERPFTDSITKTASPKNPSFELKNNLFILPNQPPTLSYGDDFLFLFK